MYACCQCDSMSMLCGHDSEFLRNSSCLFPLVPITAQVAAYFQTMDIDVHEGKALFHVMTLTWQFGVSQHHEPLSGMRGLLARFQPSRQGLRGFMGAEPHAAECPDATLPRLSERFTFVHISLPGKVVHLLEQAKVHVKQWLDGSLCCFSPLR